MSDTIYCYPDSDVLINKLDIRELDKLHTFERKLTMLRLLEWMKTDITLCRLIRLRTSLRAL